MPHRLPRLCHCHPDPWPGHLKQSYCSIVACISFAHASRTKTKNANFPYSPCIGLTVVKAALSSVSTRAAQHTHCFEASFCAGLSTLVLDLLGRSLHCRSPATFSPMPQYEWSSLDPWQQSFYRLSTYSCREIGQDSWTVLIVDFSATCQLRVSRSRVDTSQSASGSVWLLPPCIEGVLNTTAMR